MAEKTIIELQTEIDRLRGHSEDLLNERKAEKKRREEAEAALQTLTNAHGELVAKLDDLTLTGPVLRALEGVTAAPAQQGRKLLEDAGITFAVGKSGIASAMDGEEEIALPDLYRHLSKKCETPEGLAAFGWILRSSGTTGGGALGGGSARKYQPEQDKQQKVVANGLGLR